MFDHMTFQVSDIARTKEFYSAALTPLGYRLSLEASDEGVNMLGFSRHDASEPTRTKVDGWFVDGVSPYGNATGTTSCHLRWRAENRAQVDAFHKAAIAAAEGKDYGAFVIDPEGNNIEAVCHRPE